MGKKNLDHNRLPAEARELLAQLPEGYAWSYCKEDSVEKLEIRFADDFIPSGVIPFSDPKAPELITYLKKVVQGILADPLAPPAAVRDTALAWLRHVGNPLPDEVVDVVDNVDIALNQIPHHDRVHLLLYLAECGVNDPSVFISINFHGLTQRQVQTLRNVLG